MDKQTISFCFLGGPPGGNIGKKWNMLKKSIEDTGEYNINYIIHPYGEPTQTIDGSSTVPAKYWIKTQWGTKTLVIATLKMFAYAHSLVEKANASNDNNYYCLVDKTTFPIHTKVEDVKERLALLCNGKENVQKASQWIMITESFLKRIIPTCNTCVTSEKWPVSLKFPGVQNDKEKYNVSYDPAFSSKCFIRIFLRHHVYEILNMSNATGRKALTTTFINSLTEHKRKQITNIVAGGVWDENFFQVLRIIWDRPQNTVRNIPDFSHLDNAKLSNTLFKNPPTKEPFAINNVQELLSQMSKFDRPKQISHIFTNWAIWGNSKTNMLREMEKNGLTADILLSKYNEISANTTMMNVGQKYLSFLRFLYDNAKKPWWHPIEIFYNKSSAQKARKLPCDREASQGNCFIKLKDLNKGVADTLRTKPDQDYYINGMVDLCPTDDKQFRAWVLAFLMMLAYGQKTDVNLYDDDVLLQIARSYKGCLFTRKIME